MSHRHRYLHVGARERVGDGCRRPGGPGAGKRPSRASPPTRTDEGGGGTQATRGRSGEGQGGGRGVETRRRRSIKAAAAADRCWQSDSTAPGQAGAHGNGGLGRVVRIQGQGGYRFRTRERCAHRSAMRRERREGRGICRGRGQGMEGGRMIIWPEMEQRTEQWFRARAGRPTASQFSRIITATGKDSEQWDDYAIELVAQCIRPDEVEWSGNRHTDRGEELEPEAREVFSELMDLETREVGFVTRADEVIGCSPDALVYQPNGREPVAGLEIKCPLAKHHARYL
ncbi:MAG: hypothetical protein EOP61_20755, partial [Sphingomonadales bacterium]